MEERPVCVGMTIVEEIRQDPERGAKRLERECKPGLLALARRLCHDEGDAEELVNRTLAEAVARIDSLLSQTALFGWMCQILVGCHSKDVRRKSGEEEFAAGDLSETAPDADAGERVFRDVDATLVRDAIATLPQDMREALLLHYFAGMSVAQIARYVAVPAGTVKSRLHYARLALAERLREPARRAALLSAAVALLGVAAFGAASAWRASMRAVEERTVADAVRRTREALVDYYGELPPDPFAPSGQGGSESHSDSETPATQQNTEMDTTTRMAALGAASAAALAAAASGDGFFLSGWPVEVPSVSAASAATALEAPPLNTAASPVAMDARDRSTAVSAPRPLRSDEYGGIMIIMR